MRRVGCSWNEVGASEQVGGIRLSEEFDVDPDVLLQHACTHELESIIAKHRDRPYRTGRAGDWLKIKCVQSETFAILGYELSKTMPGAIGSLLLAALKGADFVYVGNVGTGFTHDQARDLKKQLDMLKTLALSSPPDESSASFRCRQ